MRTLAADAPLESWRAFAGMALVWAGLVGGLALFLALRGPQWIALLVDDGGRALLCGLTAWACRWRSRRCPDAYAACWRAFAWFAAFLCAATVYLIVGNDLLKLPPRITTLRHGGYVLALLSLGAGILALPTRDDLPTEKIQAAFDGLMIAAATFFIAWGSVLRNLVEAHRTEGTAYAYTLVYPLLSVALVALWLFQESRLRGTHEPAAGVLLRVGLVLLVIEQTGFSILSIHGAYRVYGIGEIWDMVYATAIACFGAAALWPRRSLEERAPSSTSPSRRRILLPFLPALGAMGYGASLLLLGSAMDLVMVVSGTALGAVLCARQYLTLRDLNNLSLELERRVEARTLDLRRSQQELLKAQRLQLVSAMAAGFTHDFKNLLGIIQNWAELLEGETSPGSTQQRGHEAIRDATERAHGLLRRIMDVGRPPDLHPRCLELNRAVEGLAPLLQGALKGRGSVQVQAAGSPVDAWMDPGALEQVLVNLAANAGDAFEGEGRLTLRIAEDPLEPLVILDVEDNGGGMPPSVMAHIFEPFFTTKPLGEGTGLGLASVYGLMVHCGGSISVRSEPGKGTTFTLRMPKAV